MAKQNWFNAMLMLLLSCACLIAGYYLGYEERKELAENLIETLEMQLRGQAFDTRMNLNMLRSLKEGRTDVVENILIPRVKSGLTSTPPIGHDLIDHLAGLYNPDQKTLEQALDFQSRYCADKCLGL
ncbi:MAG TPA: hypothetical protein VM011_12490 [Gammaproteobacteria bacterium]|nr:hypothetical protein [Gammaproteobacteria bacterium]